MLTREQIAKIAARNGLSLYPQERDYAQTIFLSLIYKQDKDIKIIFKGGTALRIVYNSNRYSEDLDFNCDMGVNELKSFMNGVIGKLELYGIKGEMKNERLTKNGYGFDLSYIGPLYINTETSKGKIRIDFSLRKEKSEYRKELIDKKYEYIDIEPFVVDVMNLDYILAEKFRAFFVRKKPRDLYDIWFLFKRGIKFNKNLVDKKLKLYNLSFSRSKFYKLIEEIKRIWKNDLNIILNYVPDIDAVRSDMKKFVG